MTQDMTPSKKLAIGAFCAAIAAAVAFCMPLVSFFGQETNGLDMLEGEGAGPTGMMIALIGSIAAVAFGLFGLANRKLLGGAAGGAAAALGGIFYAFTQGVKGISLIDYAAYGFWMFVIAGVACIVLSVMSMNKAKSE